MQKNYMTPMGYKALLSELRFLRQTERPKVTEAVSWAAGNGDRSENGDYIYGKKRLREIDKRIRFLSKRLESSEVIDPAELTGTEVKFAATVTLLFEDDSERQYSIVGADETDASAGRISWKSPLARAILRKQEGDYVTYQAPAGEQEVEILKVEYLPIEIPNEYSNRDSSELSSQDS